MNAHERMAYNIQQARLRKHAADKESTLKTSGLEEAFNLSPDVRPTVAAIVDMFGSCDITVEVETVAMIEIEARFKKMIYAFNNYRARLVKAETFFARLDVAPAAKEKHRPEYEDIKSRSETARAEIIRLEYELPFGKYFVEFDDRGFIKLINGETFKDIRLELSAA